MNFIYAVLLGIVEGIAEFLPISSTGHLILVSRLLRVPETEFLKTFEVVIQLGAILAVIVLYGRTLLRDARVLRRVFVAFLPTAAVGLLLYPFIKGVLLGNEIVTLAALFIGGILLIVFERWHREDGAAMGDLAALPYRSAIAIGLCQSIAIIPGVSRAAATILGGLLLGLKRKTIVEFSFLLAVPTIAAAAGLDILKSAPAFTFREVGLLAVGFAVSFLVALCAIRWLVRFIQTRSFVLFGWYRIAIAFGVAIAIFLA